jgi:acid stress-induced BolA-like protein IbaG/YrbA
MKPKYNSTESKNLFVMNIQNNIIHLIKKNIPDAEVNIEELNSNKNYIINVISSQFKNKTKVEQHKMVYLNINHLIGNEIHAISVKTSAKG